MSQKHFKKSEINSPEALLALQNQKYSCKSIIKTNSAYMITLDAWKVKGMRGDGRI
jgi:hypothetical protein